MDISLLHAGLAAGAALAALPVILHLFMRQTPKHVVFPALRLIRQRQKQSRKRLRIKNWLLLLARMALIALMALALARPSLVTQATLGAEEVPTALGLVFDTSLSMGYKQRPDKNRLDEAKERAGEILEEAARHQPGLRGRLGRAGGPRRALAGGGPQADRRPGAPRGQSPPERRGRAGLRSGRRQRPAPPRGLRPDRPGPVVLEPLAAGRGPGARSRRSSRASPPSSSG